MTDLKEAFLKAKELEKEKELDLEQVKRCGYCTKTLCICGQYPPEAEYC